MKKTALIFVVIAGLAVSLGPVVHSATLDKAMISFTFDNGRESAYALAMPALEAYGMVGTVYVISSYVESPDWITWSQLWSLYYTYGWEIGNHTVHHISLTSPSLTDAEIIDEVRGARSALESHGLINVTNLAYPYDNFNSHIISLLENDGTLYGARTGWPAWIKIPLNTLSNFKQWAIIAVDADYPETGDSIELYIDKAIQEKSWLVLIFHNVVTGSPGKYDTELTELNKMVQYVYEKRASVEVVTVSQGVAKMLRYKSLENE